MTGHHQVKIDLALLRAVQSRGGPAALLLGRQGL